MLETIISGGQTGADQAGWRAAKRFGLKTGGWIPRGYLTEDRLRPEFAMHYGAIEHPSREYPPRTRANVRMADVTLVFDTSRGRTLESLSRGSQLTINSAIEEDKRGFTVVVRLGEPIDPKRPAAMAHRLRELNPRSINVAGNRESSAPGVGQWVEEYLCEVFRMLGLEESRCEENECAIRHQK
jgi:hypothetical protein